MYEEILSQLHSGPMSCKDISNNLQLRKGSCRLLLRDLELASILKRDPQGFWSIRNSDDVHMGESGIEEAVTRAKALRRKQMHVDIIRHISESPYGLSAPKLSLKLQCNKELVTDCLAEMQKQRLVGCRRNGRWILMSGSRRV